MSANRIFLVCEAHPAIEEALCLASRHDAQSQYRIERCRCLGMCGCPARELARQHDWFKKHAACGVDRFRLAFNRPQGWDVSPPAQNTVAGGVKLALVNGSDH
jgi:hypothetical protein